MGGGVAGRAQRYQTNFQIMSKGMEELGFRFFVPDPAARGFVITTFEVPKAAQEKWDFKRFYNLLNERGMVIYPASIPATSDGPPAAFRVGNIGQLFPQDMERFLIAVKEVM